MAGFRIQYLSDLHLEKYSAPYRFKDFVTIAKNTDLLVLAGDISECRKAVLYLFLKYCKDRVERIVYVPGNHEYYGLTLAEGARQMKSICDHIGIHYLDNQVLELDDIVILGSTLWSHIPDEHLVAITKLLNDYNYIRGFSVKMCNVLYRQNVKWLTDNITKYAGKKIVVVTHHAPLPDITIPDQYRGHIANYAYASDLSDLIDRVQLWIFGHTHYSISIVKGNCKVVSNQRGYRNEPTDYKLDAHVVI
jgi:Icc-related predicted phosphoesterase